MTSLFSLSSDIPQRPRVRISKTKRPSNPKFNALAEACGNNLEELTRTACVTVAVALRDIEFACPAVTPEEIVKRARAYARKWPTWALTAPALAKRWSELGDGPRTRPARLDADIEPANWQRAASAMYPGVDFAEREWASLSLPIRSDIARKCA